MNISGLTNSSLKMLYDGIGAALAADDALVEAGRDPEHEVRTSPVWRQWAKDLSDEMVKRNITFSRIDWWGK